MDGKPYITVLTVALLVVVMAGAWNTFAPDFLPAEPPPEEAPQDTGPYLDPEYLSEKDLAFLEEVLHQPEEPGRVSAARVLAVSGDVRGVPLLLEAHRAGMDPGGVYCMAALEILRLQPWEVTWRLLLLEIEAEPAVDRACMSELNDRFRLVGGAEKAAEMSGDEDPRVRRWVAKALSAQEDEGDTLLALTSDEDPSVRRAAWLSWGLRDSEAFHEQLAALAERESDPELRSLAQEVVP